MARFIKHDKSIVGQAPGFLKFTGSQKIDHSIIEVTDFDSEQIQECQIENVELLLEYKESSTLTWINIVGLHEVSIIERVGQIFEIDPLALEDVLNVGQRPKFEEYDRFSFISLKMLQLKEDLNIIQQEQLSLLFGENYLITFGEQPGDVFDNVRERLRKKRGKIRLRKSDYLSYALIDTIVDNYIYIIENFGDLIEKLESRLLSNYSKDIHGVIYKYKQEINYIRKVVMPVRECILAFSKSENGLVNKNTAPFLKDLLDHITHGTEVIEVYREILTDQLNLVNSNEANKLNEIIRILTIFSVIFIPLTFVAAIYGTNFQYFPELKYKYSYPLFWLVLLIIATTMYFYFKRKRWL